MSSDAEYVSDLPYVRHLIVDLNPNWLRLSAAANGLVPPPIDEFDYCELGCAHGDTLVALAAAHPNASFLGIDLIEEHIDSAKKLAREGGVDNIGFLKRDFTMMLNDDIGPFDFIVAHGVLSWISPQTRSQMLELVSRKLKPGGLLYVSYNTMPGWAAVEPLRQLLLHPSAGRGEMSTIDRARKGVEFAQLLHRLGAEYFQKNPSAVTMLDTMLRVGGAYVAHEYLNENWIPMYFSRVAWEMASKDLFFAGNVPLHLNFRDTSIPPELLPVFLPISDRLEHESLKDYAINEFFRRDLYVKGRAPRGAELGNPAIDTTPFGLVGTPPADRTYALPHRKLDLSGPIYEGLFKALAEGASTLAALCVRPELSNVDEVRKALLRLSMTDVVQPMRMTTTARPVNADAVFDCPHPYNHMMLRRSGVGQPVVLVSELAGTAAKVSALDALAMRVLTEAPGPERAAWISSYVDKHVVRLAVGDKVYAEPGEQKALIGETLARVIARDLSKLVELGVLRERERDPATGNREQETGNRK